MLPRLRLLSAALLLWLPCVTGAESLRDREFRITLPHWSKLTPVQQLNRDGVEAARKHQLEKAQAYFFKAYLYDPSDPFTLDNLGYAAELSGDAERANSYYALAEKQDCDAVIDLSSLDELKGKPMLYALQDLREAPLRLNRMNVEAIELLTQNRAFEAERLLTRALALDPSNPFTLNNLGVADEEAGDLQSAAEHYGKAAVGASRAVIIVSPQKSWRGRAISELAASGQKRTTARLEAEGPAKARAAMLATRGVTAANANDWPAAKQDFLEASKLDPQNPFSLNNLGYIAERDGDLETADFYYKKARRADGAGAPVGLATAPAAQGRPLATVVQAGDAQLGNRIAAFSQAQQQNQAAPELVPRGAGAEPTPEPKPATETPAPPQ